MYFILLKNITLWCVDFITIMKKEKASLRSIIYEVKIIVYRLASMW